MINKILALLWFSLFSIVSNVDASGSEGNNMDQEVVMENIIYDYILETTPGGKPDIKGTLQFNVKVPQGAIYAIYERTVSGGSIVQDGSIRFTSGIRYEIPTTGILYVVDDKLKCDTYFRMRFILEDGTRLYSQTENTSSYIKEEDLKYFKDWSSVKSIIQNNVEVNCNLGMLYVYTTEKIEMKVYDLDGSVIFSDEIDAPRIISLENNNTPIVIVTYIINNKRITKKLKIR